MGTNSSNIKIIKDNVEIHGLNIDHIFQKPPPPITLKFVLIPAVLLCVTLLFVVLKIWSSSDAVVKLIYMVGFGSITWLAVSVQLRYKSIPATTIVVVGCIIVLLIAAGLITPRETIDIIKEMRK